MKDELLPLDGIEGRVKEAIAYGPHEEGGLEIEPQTERAIDRVLLVDVPALFAEIRKLRCERTQLRKIIADILIQACGCQDPAADKPAPWIVSDQDEPAYYAAFEAFGVVNGLLIEQAIKRILEGELEQ